MRSKLFVPGSRPELFMKALASEADALSIDLEDAVAEEHKVDARNNVAAFVASFEVAASRKTIIVRVNATDSPHFAADLKAIARNGVHLVNLPKVESAAQVVDAAGLLQQAERANGVTHPISLLVNLETPKSLRIAAKLASAHSRVAGLQLGYADLFEPLGIARKSPANVHSVMFCAAMAAGEAGVYLLDGAWADMSDTEGYRAEALMARSLGLVGKSCVHPTQIAVANEAFMPTQAELAFATRVVKAHVGAHAAGLGAFSVDGKMIDAPFVRRAHALLAAMPALGAENEALSARPRDPINTRLTST